jgi:NAD(P)-dependent dehydrogenase (short-subunit alcohol dehydrogenase family)
MNKNIIISGASGYLGRYLTSYYTKNKFNVINLSQKKPLKIFKNEYYYSCDLSSNNNSRLVFFDIKKKFKKIYGIIGCAGNSSKFNDRFDISKKFDLSIKNNLIVFINLLNQYLVNYRYKKTKIIAISSIAGVKISKAPIFYSVAKSALNFYCKAEAKRLAKYKINLNIISPGNIFMKNNLWGKKITNNKKITLSYIKNNVPLNTFCFPSQILAMCNYLLSSEADFVTGSNFVIDGGEIL